jgi:predicted aspartyl protease
MCGVPLAVATVDLPLTPIAPAPTASPLYAIPSSRDKTGRIVIPVMINNQGPFQFMLDTGASRSVLAPHMMKRLGLTLLPADQAVSLSGVTGQAIVPTTAVKRLEAGALVMEDLQMPVVSATMNGLDGMLGVDGLENKRLTVDFGNDKVIIEQSQNQHAGPDYMALPALFRYGRLLVIDAEVGRVKVKAVVDTGADGSLGTVALRQALQRKQAEAGAGAARVEGVTADVLISDLAYAPLIRFRGIEIQGVKIAYGNFHVFDLWDLESQPALLVGMDILGTVDVLVIDYLRREVQIKPRNPVILQFPRKK